MHVEQVEELGGQEVPDEAAGEGIPEQRDQLVGASVRVGRKGGYDLGAGLCRALRRGRGDRGRDCRSYGRDLRIIAEFGSAGPEQLVDAVAGGVQCDEVLEGGCSVEAQAVEVVDGGSEVCSAFSMARPAFLACGLRG